MPELKLFYCYAEKDVRLYQRLDTHLSTLKRNFALLTFSHTDVQAGKDWQKELIAHLSTADVILLLLSPDFFASEYCSNIALPLALRRHEKNEACVIPILLSDSEWSNTPLSKLTALPTNKQPITDWTKPDKAFLEVAKGIRQRIEADLAGTSQAPLRVNNIERQTKAALLAQPQLEHYLYISDKKMLNLKQQLSGWPNETPTPFQDRLAALTTVLTELQKKRQVWHMTDAHTFKEGEYIAGQCSMRWGVINWGMKVCFFFSASLPQPRVLILAGSASHLWSNRQAHEYALPQEDFGVSGSDLPGMMSAIEFAAAHSNVRWFDGVGELSDYLFLLGFIQRKFVHHTQVKPISTAFPAQSVRFTALVLKTLQPPSTKDLQDFFIDNNFQSRERKEIAQMLQQAPEILLCTPLYVALRNDECF